jgi:hypothetical protein
VHDLALAVAEFEAALPGWWWSIGQCSVGAHASCAVDGRGPPDLVARIVAGAPLDHGFHCDTDGGSPAEALRSVMQQALAYLAIYALNSGLVVAKAERIEECQDSKNDAT